MLDFEPLIGDREEGFLYPTNGEKQMFGGGAFLSFGAGPCYGRGYYYEIIHDEDGQRLGEKKILWVS